uniref:p21-activated protein kinase-interacting protein 1 n=1 Tax=Aceria tosichella TaxID=561515 RepID=A0A6G1SCI6_9ACAR
MQQSTHKSRSLTHMMTNDANSDETDLEIIVGTYEDYVVGYQVESIVKNTQEAPRKKLKNGHVGQSSEKLSAQKKTKQTSASIELLDLEQSFAVRCHSGMVRCLAASSSGRLVFSAGNDEMMNLFNLNKRKLLQTSEGSVSCAQFVGKSHLICGLDDGDIHIYECKGSNMILAKTLKGHTAGVVSMDAHPSGKVLLSVSKDHTVRTWNLIKGRCAYVTQIKAESQLVKWSRTGSEFLIAANNEIYLYNNSGNLRQRIKLGKRVNSIEFITNDIFAVAIDSGRLEFFNMSLDECSSVMTLEAHGTRIKSIKCLNDPDGDSGNSDDDNETTPKQKSTKTTTATNIRFATAASDGTIKVWSITRLRDTLKDPRELVMVDSGARITCMIVSKRIMSRSE